jgi:hypothetical protein
MLIFPLPLVARDFVVNTEVVLSHSNERDEVVTIFSGPQAFDYRQADPTNTAVFDFQSECIWRVNQELRSKQRLSFATLSRLVDEASLRAVRLAPVVRFAASPHFDHPEWNAAERRLVLRHDLITYQADLDLTIEPTQAARFRAFADWSAKLNTIAPGLPPGARLELNREIAMREAVPRLVRYSRQLPTGKREELVSSHRFRTELTPAEVSQLSKIRECLREFTEQPWQR